MRGNDGPRDTFRPFGAGSNLAGTGCYATAQTFEVMNNPCESCQYGALAIQSGMCQRGAAPVIASQNGWCAKYNLPFPDEPEYINALIDLQANLRSMRNEKQAV